MRKQKLPYKMKSLKIYLEDEVKIVDSEFCCEGVADGCDVWYHDSCGEEGGDGDGNGQGDGKVE